MRAPAGGAHALRAGDGAVPRRRHLAIDEPADDGTRFQYLRNYSFMRTDRHFDDLGVSNSVAAPAWDEKLFPCGTDWGS